MGHRIDFVEKFTGVNADVLAGSVLDPMPGPGYLRIFAGEIVDSGRITITPAKHINPTGSGDQHIPEGGGAESGAAPNHPFINAYQPHWETEVSGGEKVVIEISGTISECLIWVQYLAAR